MTGFEVDTESLRRAAREFDAAVEALDDLLDGFDERLVALGEPWGGDDIGFLIGECYLPGYVTALACFDNNLDELGTYGDKLVAMADSYERADGEASRVLRDIQPHLDGSAGMT